MAKTILCTTVVACLFIAVAALPSRDPDAIVPQSGYFEEQNPTMALVEQTDPNPSPVDDADDYDAETTDPEYGGADDDEPTPEAMKAILPYVQECQLHLAEGDVCRTIDPMKCLIIDDIDSTPRHCAACNSELEECVNTAVKAAHSASDSGSPTLSFMSLWAGDKNWDTIKNHKKVAQDWSFIQQSDDDESLPADTPATNAATEKAELAFILPFIHQCQEKLPATDDCKTIDPTECAHSSNELCTRCHKEMEGCVHDKVEAAPNKPDWLHEGESDETPPPA